MKYKIIDFKSAFDPRGYLTSIEGELDIPIKVERVFYMHHVTEDRGGHAHIDTDQVIIPINGMFKVKLFNGQDSKEFVLDDCKMGLYVPRLTFTNLYEFTPDAVCLVLANTHYDKGRSLRNMDAYLNYINKHR
ncbi:MAG: FdtA/QdtA family cupin domain-containing protein [Mangrovibacterium sp.]